MLAAGVVVGIVVSQAWQPFPGLSTWSWPVIGAGATSFAFGGLVGLSEILTRYRDEPVRATLNLFGGTYLLFNAVISLAAFLFMRAYGNEIFPSVAKDYFLTALVAGFGAMVVMRSKLFTFNAPGGQEYSIGPAIVVDTILQTIDQKIDRLRAAERQERVFKKLSSISDFQKAADYLEASVLSFQHLSDDDKAAIHEAIGLYKDRSWDDRLKVMALGFAFLTVAGEDNFDQVIETMEPFLK